MALSTFNMEAPKPKWPTQATDSATAEKDKGRKREREKTGKQTLKKI